MLIIPAIDLKKGKCVRLLRGDYSRETVYSSNPVEMASFWEKKGAEWLHIVDLDGALKREFVHWNEIDEICSRMNMKVQVGGGVTKDWIVEKLFETGVERVIVGSLAFLKPEVFLSWREKYGERIIVSVDAWGNRIKVRGWKKNSLELSRGLDWLKSIKVERLIFTDINQDGTLEGVNIQKVKEIASYGFRLIVAGGVREEKDLTNLRQIPEIEGVIIGRALLESSLNIRWKGEQKC